MKTPSRFWILLILFIALLCVLLLAPRKQRTAHTVHGESAKTDTVNGSSLGRTRRSKAAEVLARDPDIITVANSMQADPAAIAERALRGKAVMEDKNVEINFYGKVVDQNDHPLAGAAIQAETREWFMKNPFEPGGKFLRPVAVTGADGLFRFTRLHGDALGILSITKEGYKLTTKAKVAYSYGPLDHHFVPNSLMPVIFHMWRTNGAVPLYVVDISMSIPQDGTELSFDLRRNKRVTLPTEDTDLRVTLSQHAPPGQRGVDPHFDWSFTIEALNGGLLQAQAEFTYLAPEQGYHPKLAGEYHKEQSNWKFQDGADFYLHNRGQQYGRLSIHFKANAGYPTGYLTIRGYLNPNGRVLEFDTFKKLYPPPMGALGGSSASVPVRSPVQFTLPSAPGSVPPGVPAFPQPPPGFEALTNRARGFAPPVPPRPPQ